MKTCKTCGIEKEETEFFKKRQKTREGSCKICKKERVKYLISLDPLAHAEKERLRSETRRKTPEFKEWRKDHQKRNRKLISQKAIEMYHKTNVLETQRVWKERNREKLKKYAQECRKKFPFKVIARRYVRKAIAEGIIVKPEECSECLKKCNAEAHHEDYSRPLDVIWLCRS